MLFWPFKTPTEIADYFVDWSDRMSDTDTIQSVTWTLPSGITKLSENTTGQRTTVFLSGGTLDETYDIGVEIVTGEGLTLDDTCRIAVKAR